MPPSNALRYVLLLSFVLIVAVVMLALRPAVGTAPEPVAPVKAGGTQEVTAVVLRPGRKPAPAALVAPGRHVGSGEASYYGDELRGRPTASGEAFDPGGYTAAHRTLPLGARVRVTNLRNGESVVVRVNDRGPFHGDRVLDLSEQAARDLGMLGRGTADVRIELVRS